MRLCRIPRSRDLFAGSDVVINLSKLKIAVKAGGSQLRQIFKPASLVASFRDSRRRNLERRTSPTVYYDSGDDWLCRGNPDRAAICLICKNGVFIGNVDQGVRFVSIRKWIQSGKIS